MGLKVHVWCPAKVNLFLAVGPADSIGYHPLRTIFQAIGLFDELTFQEAEEDSFICSSPAVPSGTNTVSKAIRLLREYGDVPPLRVELVKRIPTQAGLGGGSSDAAGLLRSVNRFTVAPFSKEVLLEVACAVGADVPFFLVGGSARAEGYGERLEALEDSPTRWLAIVKPENVHCPTPDAYRRLDELSFDFQPFPIADEWLNEFERVMPSESADIKQRLTALGASRTLLCGSGSAVVGEFASKADTLHAVRTLERDGGVHSWAAPTLTRAESLRIDD